MWQKLAAKTHGVLTPGNLLSVGGAGILSAGLVCLYNGSLGMGLSLVIVGRIADIADGVVAAKTGTKSPLGEALDATVDKLALLATVITLLMTGLTPWLIVLAFTLFNAVNAVCGGLARLQSAKIHPSKFGKFAAALQWLTIVLFLLSALLAGNQAGMAGTIIAALGWICFVNASVISSIATIGYILKVIAIKAYHARI